MQYNVKKINPQYEFYITGVSYIGEPESNTAMFITKKAERLLEKLRYVKECLVFVQKGINVPAILTQSHCIVFMDNPQLGYASFAAEFDTEKRVYEKKFRIIHTTEGYDISESAQIGKNAYIEPGCFIGHGVIIGKNAKILKGSVIKNSIIGDDFLSNEYAVIGSNGFTIAKDEYNNKIRIPSLGGVRIGNNVEIGVHDNISRGTAGNTVIEDFVKIDALVYIGHDVYLERNAEITAGAIVGGFVRAGTNSYIGINSSIRNRIDIGEASMIGMGATVTKSVCKEIVVVGNPAKELQK